MMLSPRAANLQATAKFKLFQMLLELPIIGVNSQAKNLGAVCSHRDRCAHTPVQTCTPSRSEGTHRSVGIIGFICKHVTINPMFIVLHPSCRDRRLANSRIVI